MYQQRQSAAHTRTYTRSLTHSLLQLLTGIRRMVSDRCSTVPLCWFPGPVYTPHRCSRPSSWPPSLWCPHSPHDTSWCTGRSQCRTFREKKPQKTLWLMCNSRHWLVYSMSINIPNISNCVCFLNLGCPSKCKIKFDLYIYDFFLQ